MREILLILHFLGLALGLGTSFGFMFLGFASSKMEKPEALKFQLNAMALSRMGHVGLTLLILSGIGLMMPYWAILGSSPLLITKLLLVVVLAALIGIVSSFGRKARQGDAEAQLKKIQPLGRMILLVGVAIVALAVFIFR